MLVYLVIRFLDTWRVICVYVFGVIGVLEFDYFCHFTVVMRCSTVGKGKKKREKKYIYICEEDVVVDVELNEARNQEKKRETIAGQGPGVPLVLKNVL